jgi:hypothetical protein
MNLKLKIFLRRQGDVERPWPLTGARVTSSELVCEDIPAAMDHAVEQGWLRKISNDEYRLTDAGFAAGS